MIAVRPARFGDRQAILRLIVAMGGHEGIAAHQDPLRRLGGLLRASEARLAIAEVDGTIAGFAELQAMRSAGTDRREAKLSALAVDPRYRGAGVGAELLRYFEREALLLGCNAIFLNSSARRVDAHRFYRTNGYAEIEPAHRFVRAISAPAAVDLAERFLYAAASAVTAAADAIAALEDCAPVAVGADHAPTEAGDRAAEEAAVAALTTLGLPIVSEECGLVGRLPGTGEAWISLDPLDGSRNYRAGYPPFATAIGLVRDGVALAGFVGEHVSGRRWWAVCGKGAFKNGNPIRTRRGPLAAIPSPAAGQPLRVPGGGFTRARVSGCTTVDLCSVADGSLAAFYALERAVVHVHDLSGALAILTEAGGSAILQGGAVPLLVPDPALTFPLVAAADAALANELVRSG